MAGRRNDCPHCQEHLAASDVAFASIAVTIRKPVRLGTHSLAFLSLWFSADDMLLEKWHEPELLADLAAPEIVDWQSWVVLRPRVSERARSFVRYVFHQASRNTRLRRCFFQEFIVQAGYILRSGERQAQASVRQIPHCGNVIVTGRKRRRSAVAVKQRPVF